MLVRSIRSRLLGNLRRFSSTMAVDETKYDELKEGSATILFPKNKVFYNPVQQYNRDLSALAIRAFTEMFAEEQKARKRNRQPEGTTEVESEFSQPYAVLMEALSASGLRSVRYAKECPLIKTCIANDLSEAAVKSIELNIEHNGVGDKVRANHADAIKYMAQQRKAYHVIDLDPYGTASPFMDSAIQSIKDGGMMLVTCTDLGVLAGNGYPEKCFGMYGGSNPGGDATHEAALRLVLSMIASTAAKYRKTIEPLLSLSIDFYVRLFVRVREQPIKVKELGSKTMIVQRCTGCYAMAEQPLGKVTIREGKPKKFGLAVSNLIGPKCTFCGSSNHITGPMWGGPLHDRNFIDRILTLQEQADTAIYKTLPRVKGMLSLARGELTDSLFYFKPSSVSTVLKMPVPPMDVISAALGNLGYKAALSHTQPNTIKTDAPWEVIWFIGKKLFEKDKLSVSKFTEEKPAYKILTNEEIGKGIDLTKLRTESGWQPEAKLELTEEEGDEEEGAEKTEAEMDIEWLFHRNEVSADVNRMRKIKLVRYQENPTKNWGPKARPAM